MSSFFNKLTGKSNNADSNSTQSSSSMSSMSSGSSSSMTTEPTNTTGYNPNTHTQGYSNSGYGTSGAGTGTAPGIAGYNQGTASTTNTTGADQNLGGNDRYITRSEEQLRVGKEAYESGRAQLGKHVTTEQVSTAVPISKERVVVEREPITSADIQQGGLRGDIGEASYEMRLKEERAIAEKETVPIEKVRMRKEVETTQQQVGADLRKEHIDYNDGLQGQTDYNKDAGYNLTTTKTDTYGGMPTTTNTGYGATTGTTNTTTQTRNY